jgi:hypothetical protein
MSEKITVVDEITNEVKFTFFIIFATVCSFMIPRVSKENTASAFWAQI